MKLKQGLIVSALSVLSSLTFLAFLILWKPWAGVEAAESEYRLCPTASTCTIGEFLYDDDYDPIPGGGAWSCTLTSRYPDSDPSDPPLLDGVSMTGTSNGWYYYNVVITSEPEGLYRSTMCCTDGTDTICLDKGFIIGPDVESAVWDAGTASHDTANTFGWYLQNPLGLAKDIWGYSTRTLSGYTSLVADIWNNTIRSLTTREITPTEHIAQEETLEKHWTTRFSGDGEVLAGKQYRAKLWVLNYNTELADAVSLPTVTMYDAERNPPAGAPATMTKIATGIYELVYNVPSTATGGRWETVVTVDVGGAASIQDGSYWEVESSPAEVKINAITDNTIPLITANITITNEGGSGYEYKYAYCVVAQEGNACGGGNDVFYSSGSKWLNAGQSWTTDKSATVSTTGQYWFKVVVQWGTEKSGASQMFTASEVTCLGDLNNDGWVNLTDFSILLFYWNTSSPIADLNNDGKVNLTDFSIMLFHWGKCP